MGALGARELTGLLADLRAGRNTVTELERRAMRSRDPELQAELARRHALRGDPRAEAELDAVVAGDPDDRAGRASQALLVLGKYVALRGRKDYRTAARALERLLADYPRSRAAEEAPFHLAAARHGLGDDAGALAALDAWVAGAADDAARAERSDGYGWCCLQYRFGRERAIATVREAARRFGGGRDGARLWDTLAELHAQAGRAAEARAAEARAAQMAPDDPYYASQLARFGGGHG
jgi:tetratricopeptide (TPR) repeat protein